MDLVDETRTSFELEVILNYDPEGKPRNKGERMQLTRLKEAIDSGQKQVKREHHFNEYDNIVYQDICVF